MGLLIDQALNTTDNVTFKEIRSKNADASKTLTIDWETDIAVLDTGFADMEFRRGGSTLFRTTSTGVSVYDDLKPSVTNGPYLGASNRFWRGAYLTTVFIGASDVSLYRDAAGALAQRNGTNAQEFRLYNTYTDASNYERGVIKWDSDVLYLGNESDGTGTNRVTRVGGSSLSFRTGNGLLTGMTERLSLDANDAIFSVDVEIDGNITTNSRLYFNDSSTQIYKAASKITLFSDAGTEFRFGADTTGSPFKFTSSSWLTLNASAGIQSYISLTPNYNQTGTAGSVDIFIDRTETALGSGDHYLIDAQVGGVSKFSVSNAGGLTLSSDISFESGGEEKAKIDFQKTGNDSAIVFKTTTDINPPKDRLKIDHDGEITFFDQSGDTRFVFDSESKTFSSYNTYTDAINYERVSMGWNSNVFEIDVQEAGTGVDRYLLFPGPGSDSCVVGSVGGGNSQSAFGVSAGYQNTGWAQIAVGRLSGYQNTGGDQIAIGYYAGYQNTGDAQVAIGSFAGYLNTVDYQTAVGISAGQSNSGSQQSAFGYAAGQNNGGFYQCAFGSFAGDGNTGSTQTASGHYAGSNNTGSNQVAIGYRAGRDNTGDNCVFLGYEAGYQNTLDNRFELLQAQANASALLEGDFATGVLNVPGTLELRDGTNPKTFNLYNTYTDASNYERGLVKWDTNRFTIGTEVAGTGSNRDVWFTRSGGLKFYLTSTSVAFSVDALPGTTGTTDLGLTTNRWAGVYSVDGNFSGDVSIGQGSGLIFGDGDVDSSDKDIIDSPRLTSGFKLVTYGSYDQGVRFDLDYGGLSSFEAFHVRYNGDDADTPFFIDRYQNTTFGRKETEDLSRVNIVGDLRLEDAANPCKIDIYNTYTDALNYERGFVKWDSDRFQIGTEELGTGSSRHLSFVPAGTETVRFTTGGTVRVANALYFGGVNADSGEGIAQTSGALHLFSDGSIVANINDDNGFAGRTFSVQANSAWPGATTVFSVEADGTGGEIAGAFAISGGVSFNVETFTAASDTLDANNHTCLCDCTSNAITINLPAAASHTGRVYVIKKIDATANAVTIDGNGAETIDGAANKVISTQWNTARVVSDGSNWYIV